MTTLLTTSPSFGRLGASAERLAALGWTLLRAIEGDPMPDLAPVEFIVAGLIPVNDTVLDQAPRLRGVLKHGVGVDRIDIPACTARGIPVLSTPGANANAVVELTLGLMLDAARHIRQTHDSLMAGEWHRRTGIELRGKVLGIIGLGTIGRQVARAAQALGMTVIATDLLPDPAYAAANDITLMTQAELLARADVVSLHIDGRRKNAGWIGAPEIRAMKPGACLMNLARGEVLEMDALAAALSDGHLAGAGIDAFRQEPPDLTDPIFHAPNVTFTPHTGAATRDSDQRVAAMILDDIETILAGGRPDRVLNPEIYG